MPITTSAATPKTPMCNSVAWTPRLETPTRDYDRTLKQVVIELKQRISDLAELASRLPQSELSELHTRAPPWSTDESSQLLPVVNEAVAPLPVHSCPADMDAEHAGDLDLHMSRESTGSTGSLSSKKFTLKQGWTVDFGKQFDQSHILASHFSSQSQLLPDLAITYQPTLLRKSWVLSSPESPRRIIWECLGVILAVYDMVCLPLVLAFNLPSSTFQDSIDWIARVFWVVNVPIVLTTGFMLHGEMILDARCIFNRYVRTWLIVDVITIPLDWASLVLAGTSPESNTGAGTTVRFARALRVMRIVRLARVAKLRSIIRYIYDCIDSEQVGIIIEVLRMVLCLMLVNHYNACLFLFVAKSRQQGNNWIDAFGYADGRTTWEHQWLVAYHWSITQFTPSSMNVQPVCVEERVFAIVVSIFGLVGFSYLVGSITGSLGLLRAIAEQKTKQFWVLRKFLKKNSVPHQLSARIRKYVERKIDKREKLWKLSDMEFVNFLSESLRHELEGAIHGPILCTHPLFEQLYIDSTVTIQRLAHSGVFQLCLAPEDMLFHAGEAAAYMSFLTAGTVQYKQQHRVFPDLLNDRESIRIAEQALWVNGWHHLGDLRSDSDSEFMLLGCDKLLHIVRQNPLASWMTGEYAQSYVKWLNDLEFESRSDIALSDDLNAHLKGLVKKYEGVPIASETVPPSPASVSAFAQTFHRVLSLKSRRGT